MNTYFENRSTLDQAHRGELSDRIFIDDLYVIDVLSDFSVISSRAKSNDIAIGNCFLDLLQSTEKFELKKKLLRFDLSPIVLPCKMGSAIVLRSLFPSSQLCPIILTDLNADDLPLEEVSWEELSDRREPRLRERLIGIYESAKPFLPDVSELYSGEQNDLRLILKDQCHQLAETCGCKIETTVSETDPKVLGKDLDLSLFTAFITLSLLLSRRVAKERRAKIFIESSGERPLISVEFEPLDEYKKTVPKELITLRSIAERLNTVFYRTVENGRVTVKFCPCRKDWSLYGLKTRLNFLWENYESDPTSDEPPQA